jgi:Family of unknown function (DUF5989)
VQTFVTIARAVLLRPLEEVNVALERRKGIVRLIENLISYGGIVGELLSFFWHNKWWWLTPMIFVLMIFGGLIVFAQSSAVAPFIYTLF